MNQFKYYTSGQPKQSRMPMYGLYHLVLDRFIVVANTESAITSLRFLLSSKYPTVPVCLNSAGNYVFGMITNENCDQWTFNKQQTDILIANILMHIHIQPINLLIPQHRDSDFDAIAKEKQWALYCLYWIDKIIQYRANTNNYVNLDININNFLEIKNLDYQTSIDQKAIKKVLKTLYLGNDISTVEQELSGIPF